MGERVTNSMLLRTALANISRQRIQLQNTQEQVASGLRINRPSDDPVGVRAAALLKTGLDANAQFQRNIGRTRPRVAAAESAVGNVFDLLVRARELALAGANAGLDAGARAGLASEVEALHGRLLSEANTRAGGAYIFAGNDSDAPAFSTAGPFPPTVTFDGDATEIQVDIDASVRVTVTLNGQRVFLGDVDGDGSPDAGRRDVFQILADLHTALTANNPSGVAATLDDIDVALDQLSNARTRIGSVQTQLDDFQTKLGQREVDLVQRLSDVQDADAAEVISSLILQENALRISLEATARLVQPTLLDFL